MSGCSATPGDISPRSMIIVVSTYAWHLPELKLTELIKIVSSGKVATQRTRGCEVEKGEKVDGQRPEAKMRWSYVPAPLHFIGTCFCFGLFRPYLQPPSCYDPQAPEIVVRRLLRSPSGCILTAFRPFRLYTTILYIVLLRQ